MDVTSAMRRAAGYFADHEAVAQEGASLTFAQAWSRGVQVANGLRAMGLEPGDRIGTLEGNTVGAADLFLGAAIANLVRVPLYAGNSREAHRHMLGHTGCRALVVEQALLDQVAGLTEDLPDLAHVLIRDDGYEDWLARQDTTDPMLAVADEDPFVIRHTGGTTGLSKGVAYSHRAWLAAGRDWFYSYPPVQPDDTCLHIGPIAHGAGYLFVPIWLGGGRNLLVNGFDPTACLDLMETEKVAYTFMVPAMVTALLQDGSAEARDWSHLKSLLIAGAPITDDAALAARAVFGDVLYQAYGQTEVALVAIMGSKQWFAEVPGSTPLRASGQALPFAGLEIRGPDNRPLGAGEVGHIAARSEGQMTSYWNNPEATAETLVDGWVLTGDMGMIDGNGYLYMLDRAGDVISSGGQVVWPTEIENAVSSHPAVVEAAAFGVPDSELGEAVVIVCVTGGEDKVPLEELSELAAPFLPAGLTPIIRLSSDALPKSPVGKVLRSVLRDRYRD